MPISTKFDWTAIDDAQFEELLLAIATDRGAVRAEFRKGPGDKGRDVQAWFNHRDALGVDSQDLYFFEAKHHAAGVSPDHISGALAWQLAHALVLPQVMTADKLFGAAAGYLLLGILWADIYGLVQYMDPEAFGGGAGSPLRSYYDLVYMSFGCLTSNGAGDILPMGSRVRSLVILEQLTGTLFVAILIARLAGIYPAPENAKAADSSR